MKIQTNASASFALNYMSVNEKNTQQSIQRLSSGFRINKAGDDAAGLAIANKLRSDSKGLGQAQKNVAQASSMLQVMDGATQTVSGILDRMKELATQANSANIGTQSGQLQKEFTQLSGEIDRIASTTNYQGTKLLDGTFGNALVADATTSGASFNTAATAGAVSVVNSNSLLDAGVAKIAFTYAKGTAAVAGPPAVAEAPGTLTATLLDKTGQAITGGTLKAQIGSTTAGTSVMFASSPAGGAFDAAQISFKIPAAFDFTKASAASGGNGTFDGTAADDTLALKAQQTGSFQVSSSGSYAYGGNDQIQVRAVNVSSAGLGLAGLDLTTQDNAAKALTALDAATNTVSTALGSIGSSESRLEFASTNVATALQNTQAAESTIRDTDMAAEMTNFTKNNVLQQAAQSMLSQANQGSQSILKLLQ